MDKYKSISNSLKINQAVWIAFCPFMSFYMDATSFMGCCIGIAGANLFLLYAMDKALYGKNKARR